MRLCLRTDLYVGVPVYFWPWVFWQLLQLDLWVEQTGRSVLGAVCKRTGEVFISFTGDNPEEARPWRESDLQALLPKALSRALLVSAHPGQAQRDPGPRATSPEAPMEVPDQVRDSRNFRCQEGEGSGSGRFEFDLALSAARTRDEAGSRSSLRSSDEPGSRLCS